MQSNDFISNSFSGEGAIKIFIVFS